VFDGLADQLDALLQRAPLAGGDTQHVIGVGVVGVGIQNLPVEDFRLIKTTLLMMLYRKAQQLFHIGHGGVYPNDLGYIVNVIAMKSTTLGQQLTNHGGQLRRIEYDLLPRPGIIKIIYKGREKFVMGKP
jgi:hypothetical protein